MRTMRKTVKVIEMKFTRKEQGGVAPQGETRTGGTPVHAFYCPSARKSEASTVSSAASKSLSPQGNLHEAEHLTRQASEQHLSEAEAWQLYYSATKLVSVPQGTPVLAKVEQLLSENPSSPAGVLESILRYGVTRQARETAQNQLRKTPHVEKNFPVRVLSPHLL